MEAVPHAPLSSLQLLPPANRSRRRQAACPLIKIQCKDTNDRLWVIQRCPSSIEQLSSLLPGRQVISYSALLSAHQPAQSSPTLDDRGSSSFASRGSSFRSKSKSLIGGAAGVHKHRPSLSGSISSMSGLISSSSSAATAEVLDAYTDMIDALLRKIIRQRRDDDPAVREWFYEGWGVAVEEECTLDGCRLRHFKGLQRLGGLEQQERESSSSQAQRQTKQASPIQSQEGDFALNNGRLSPFDAGSQSGSGAAAQRRSQQAPALSSERLCSFPEESTSTEATPRIPQATTPLPEQDCIPPTEPAFNTEGVVQKELKWIIEHFPLPPKEQREQALAPADKFTPAFTTSMLLARKEQQRPTTPESPAAIEIRLRQASITPATTYSARSSASNFTNTALAKSAGTSMRNRGSTSTCGSYATDFSQELGGASNRSSRESNGPLTPKSLNMQESFLAVVNGDHTPGQDAYTGDWRQTDQTVSPRTLSKPLPTDGNWRPKTPPSLPPTQPTALRMARSPPTLPPPAAPLPPPPTSASSRPFAALLDLEPGTSSHEPPRPTGPRQFSSMSVLSSPGSSLGPHSRSPSPRKGSLLPPAGLEASADGYRYHRPHQGVLNPYLRKSPSPSPSLSPLPSVRSTASASPEPTAAVPPSGTSTTLPAVEPSENPLKIFKIFIPSAERTISVPVGTNDTLIELRDKISTKLKRTKLELPDKWSLATAQLSATREKIVGNGELEMLLAGKLRNGDPSQPCLLRVIEA